MGRDKSLLEWKEKPLYRHVYQEICTYCKEVFISCKKEQADNYELPVIVDVYENIGPISGIISSLMEIKEHPILTIPCDMPHINKIVIEAMIAAYDPSLNGVFLKENNGNIEPLVAIYNPSVLPLLMEKYLEGSYSLQKFIAQLSNVRFVNISENSLININTPDEFINFKKYNQ